MIRTLVFRLIVGVSTFHAFQVLLTTGAAWSQTHSKHALFPLEARSFEIENEAVGLETVSDRINTHLAGKPASDTKKAKIDISRLPIIGELVDKDGNLDWGMDLPFSIGIGDVLGQTGIVLTTDLSPEPADEKP